MAGLATIKIPLRKDEVSLDTIRPYLDDVFGLFQRNQQKIISDYDMYMLTQKILNKTRTHSDEINNNKVLNPNVYSMVNWKSGYIFGNPMKYAETGNASSEKMRGLNLYLRDSNKASVDRSVSNWIYATGVGYYFVQPKKVGTYDDKSAPFSLTAINSYCCCKVKSAYIGEEPLFDLIHTKITRANNVSYDIVDLYLPDWFYEFEISSGASFATAIPSRAEKRLIYKELPLVEKKANPNAISIPDVVRSLSDAVDTLMSDQLDNIQDITNVIYKYKNVAMGSTDAELSANHKTVKRNGAIVLNTANEQVHESDLDILKIPPLDYAEINDIVAQLTRTAYYSVGCPMPNSEITSGNITRGGGEITSGHDNAYNIALAETTNFMPADYDLLRKILVICNNSPKSLVKNLSASDIEIKYSFNLADNILSKVEAYSLLVQTVPPALALRLTRISNDPEADGATIEEYMEKQYQQKLELQTAKTTENIDVTEESGKADRDNKFVKRDDT